MDKPNPHSLYQIACALNAKYPNAYNILLSAAKEGKLPGNWIGGFIRPRFESTIQDAVHYLKSIKVDPKIYRIVLGVRVCEKDFWSKVEVQGVDDCWFWRGSIRRDGYGQYCGKKQTSAHRIALALRDPPKLPSLVAMHICDNPACCNPRHLRWGTVAENNADKVVKGRQAKGDKCKPKNLAKCYKRLHEDGMSITQIAEQLQVTRQAVRKVLQRALISPPPAPPP